MKITKTETIEKWRSTRINVDDIPSQIEKLCQEQHVYAEKEDFDNADAIQQQIRELTSSAENYKFQFPILSQEVRLHKGAVAQWYSQRTSVLEVAGSIPTPLIVELL